MHRADLRRWLNTRDLAVASWEQQIARLADHRLCWNYRSDSRQAGAANVVPAVGETVYGAMLRGGAALLAALDIKEGHPRRYSRGTQPVTVDLGPDGEAKAWLYRVTAAYEVPEPCPPTADYLRLLVEAADELGLPADYRDALRQTPTLLGAPGP